jgi:cysteinyl-tRNA synthetase
MRWTSPWGEGFPGWHIECTGMSTKYLGKQFDIHGGGMDLQFPHHECEIAQSTVCNHQHPARYWVPNNMITIHGKRMGKSYNNVIKLTELFSGTHPILAQAYHPMTIRFFILQSHYRSTLDFSNEALQAAEKALKRLWEAYTNLQSLTIPDNTEPADAALDIKVKEWVNQFTKFMDDDLSTAKVLANMFELAPVINSLKNKQIPENSLSSHTVQLLQQQMKLFIEDIFGLQNPSTEQNDLWQKVMQFLLNIRKQAKAKKDFVTADTIRNELLAVGIQIKDEKDGSMSYTLL